MSGSLLNMTKKTRSPTARLVARKCYRAGTAYPADEQKKESVPQEKFESALAKMKTQSANGKSFDDFTDEEKEKIKKALKTQIRVESLLHDICKNIAEPSEQDIQNFYNRNKEYFKSPE